MRLLCTVIESFLLTIQFDGWMSATTESCRISSEERTDLLRQSFSQSGTPILSHLRRVGTAWKLEIVTLRRIQPFMDQESDADWKYSNCFPDGDVF